MNRIPTILLVDDNRANRRILRSLLESDGYDVRSCVRARVRGRWFPQTNAPSLTRASVGNLQAVEPL